MKLIHLIEGDDRAVTCNIVDHSLRIIDHVVGVAAFRRDVGYGGVSSSKALRKNLRDASRVTHFLGGINVPCSSDHDRCRIDVGDHGLIWYEADRFKGKVYDGPSTVFRKITFSYGSRLNEADCNLSEKVNMPRSTSEHLMSFRCRTMGPDECLSKYKAAPITIVSGVCMFSNAILEDIRNLDDDDMNVDRGHLEELAHHPALHAVEAVCRLSPAIADMICILHQTLMFLAHNKSSSADPPLSIRVKLDVPRLAYYDLARDMLVAQKWNFRSATRWLSIVDQRHDILYDEFSTAICNRLRERGLDPSRVKIYSSSGSQAAEDIYTKSIHNGQLPSADACIAALKADSENCWSTFLGLIQRPQLDGHTESFTIQDLARLAYTYEYFEPFLETNSSRVSRVVLAVDDPRERKIFDSALKVLDKHEASRKGPKHILIGVFVFFRILCAPSKDLFRFDCRRKFHLALNKTNAPTHHTLPIETVELADIVRQVS